MCWAGARRASTSKKWPPPSSKYAPIYAAFAGREIVDLAKDPKALALGPQPVCQQLHQPAMDRMRAARPGFPNLTDNDWLHGGAPAAIVQTITHGREGIMPALGAALGEQGVDEVAAYVLESERAQGAGATSRGRKGPFRALCAACHGADGKGNQAIGAPNLTDDIWLYGGSEAAVRKSITDGRHGQMPAHEWLGDDKIRLLAAYVYSLSHAP